MKISMARIALSLVLSVALIPIELQAQQSVSAAQREELRKSTDEARERNAREREAIQKNLAPNKPNPPQSSQSVTALQICKAAIAALMGRTPDIVSVTQETGGVLYLAYIRPSDRSTWRNRCKVNGTTVMWATEPGRWRDHPLDEKVTFRTAGSNIVIKQLFSDGSASEKTFPISAL
jgi:hypothetical protein